MGKVAFSANYVFRAALQIKLNLCFGKIKIKTAALMTNGNAQFSKIPHNF